MAKAHCGGDSSNSSRNNNMPTAIAPAPAPGQSLHRHARSQRPSVRSRYHRAMARLSAALTGMMKAENTEAAKLTDDNIRDAVKRWFDPETRQAVVDEFGKIGDWQVGEVTSMKNLFRNRSEFNEDLSRWETGTLTSLGKRSRS